MNPAIETEGQADLVNTQADLSTQPAHVSLEMFRQIVTARSAIVVDARLNSVFRKGHVPGAVNLPGLRPDEEVLRRILKYPKSVAIIVYCASENCEDSYQVSDSLRKKGMRNIRIFRGGWQEWQEYGLEIETGP